MTTAMTDPHPIKVFVQLSHGQDAAEWERNQRSGALIGINDPSPYGYRRAEREGCEVRFSRAGREGLLGKGLRGALRLALGFDLVHALRNRAEIFRADIVWTHTEAQFLAVAMLLSLARRSSRPKLLGQSVWLMDEWRRLSPLHRPLYRWLLRRVDVLTFHSPENRRRAQAVFGRPDAELVPFGIPNETVLPPLRAPVRPVKVLSVGNDRHRDWATLLAALGSQNDIELTIVSRAIDPRLTRPHANVRVVAPAHNDELLRLYATNALMVVPLKENLHASGITVLQEAALCGLALVATRTGGLDANFDEAEATYVPVGDAAALRTAVRELAADPARRDARAAAAQRRMTSGALGCEAYISRHVALSRRALARR
ncbi:glycosyltransferase [Ancylobacter polymorphus]|uniref:Glycosyltransferase n=1 Tax=Ancylobacter polymorphus TaxID=223390 RepID=A0A9E7A9C2_9HYPH|nr:glycosyltransferase [Ancylobacter polymorphus]UOK72108.1 glycosyltransferase [Ancylobacter polymorphus]